VNLVDSCGWLEYFADGANAGFFTPAITDTEHLLVPTVILSEVFKRVLQQRDEHAALQAVAIMLQGQVVELSAEIALIAAKLGHEHKLPLADSIILASARHLSAVVWTQDADFEGLEGVRYIRKATVI
jgi:predicted nucleic acid-binding protein